MTVRRVGILVCALMMATALSGCDWTAYLAGNGRSGFNVGESDFNPSSATNLKLAWQTSDSGSPESGVFSQPIVADNTVYWGSFDGYERATDMSGHLVWQTFLGHTDDPSCTDPSSAGIASTATWQSALSATNPTPVLFVGLGVGA